MDPANYTPDFWAKAQAQLASYDQELEDARRMDEEHPDPDMSCSYENAVVMSRIELEHCRCPRDAGGYPSPDNVNDLCEWHGGAIERAIESGKFWSEPWPWGETAAAAGRPGSKT